MSRGKPSTIVEWFLHQRLGKFNGFTPEACLRLRLARTADYPFNRVDERLHCAIAGRPLAPVTLTQKKCTCFRYRYRYP
ncbi:hypothetical protein [Cupriavidus basilensis]|uniref:hypothetical protein n=1 Tax=Cupriavidus basilensis TaxID=68895 RepID=UPI0011857CA9|nr:hypothetical protein [Cupriavidus basilensis]